MKGERGKVGSKWGKGGERVGGREANENCKEREEVEEKLLVGASRDTREGVGKRSGKGKEIKWGVKGPTRQKG